MNIFSSKSAAEQKELIKKFAYCLFGWGWIITDVTDLKGAVSTAEKILSGYDNKEVTYFTEVVLEGKSVKETARKHWQSQKKIHTAVMHLLRCLKHPSYGQQLKQYLEMTEEKDNSVEVRAIRNQRRKEIVNS